MGDQKQEIDYLQKAESLASEGEKLLTSKVLSQALRLYQEAIAVLLAHSKVETNAQKKKIVYGLTTKYLDRAEKIKDYMAIQAKEEDEENQKKQRKKNVALLNIQLHLRKDKTFATTQIYKGKRYYRCFQGSALVTWLLKRAVAENEAEAIKIGQNLINAALMIHITSDELFSNSRALFRLLDQEAWIVHLQMRDPVSGLVKFDPDLAVQNSKKKKQNFNDKVLGTNIKFSGKIAIDWLMDLKALGFQKRSQAVSFGQRLLENYLVEGDQVFVDSQATMYNFKREIVSMTSLYENTKTGLFFSHWGSHPWKIRYFVFVPDQERLFLFKNDQTDKPKGNIDLRCCTVQTVDESMFNRKHCLQLVHEGTSFYLSFPSDSIRAEWNQIFQNISSKENLNLNRRQIRKLKIGIMEGVNLPTDISNFYCQIFLAKAMVARTQVQWKIKDGAPSWTEDFVLDEIQKNLTSVDITLMTKSGLLKSNTEVGKTSLFLKDLSSNVIEEQWLPLTLSVKTSEKDKKDKSQTELSSSGIFLQLRTEPSILVQYSLEEELILSLEDYDGLLKLFVDNFEIATSLCEASPTDQTLSDVLQILESQGRALHFVMHLVEQELQHVPKFFVKFNDKSACVKFVMHYIKVIAGEYIGNVLEQPLKDLIKTLEEETEEEQKDENESSINYAIPFWQTLYSSVTSAPIPLKLFCKELWEATEAKFPDDPDAPYMAISSFFILRFICPMIISYRTFDIMNDYTDFKASKALRGIAKIFQLLGNVRLELNSNIQGDAQVVKAFLSKHRDKMKEFLAQLSLHKETKVHFESNATAVDVERLMAQIYSQIITHFGHISQDCSNDCLLSLGVEIQKISSIYQSVWPDRADPYLCK